jgi:hypothetical protein
MFTALRRQGAPVEFVIYPDEGHVITQPTHRLASMQRNLDWMAFWLLEHENPDVNDENQYGRWNRMRALLDVEPGRRRDDLIPQRPGSNAIWSGRPR